MIKSLHDLAKSCGNQTDKQDSNHCFSGENYLHYYERHFDRLRFDNLKILEIGVGHGESLKLWMDYFEMSHINGLDIRPDVETCLGERITVHIGDQSDTQTLIRISESHGPFNIVVDDGSHVIDHILSSFRVLFPLMPSGAVYAMEDMRCTYHGADRGWLGMEFNKKETNYENSRGVMDAEFMRMIHDLDNMTGMVRSIHFYSMVSIINKL